MKKVIFYSLIIGLFLFIVSCSKSNQQVPAGTDTAAVSAGQPADQTSNYTGKIKISKIEKEGEFYNITLNDLIEIKKVEVKDGNSGKYLAFPKLEGKYNCIFIKDKALNKSLTDAVLQNKTEKNSPKDLSITDIKVKKFDKSKSMKGVVSVLMENAIEFQSFKILERKKSGLFVANPSERKKEGYGYENVVYIREPLKKMLEEKILAAYKNAKDSAENNEDEYGHGEEE